MLIGRLEGANDRDIAFQLSSAKTCVLGALVSGAVVGAPIIVRTDSSGYFGIVATGVGPGDFVALKATSAPVGPSPAWTPSSGCLVSSRDNDSWPKAFPLDGTTPSIQDLIDAPGKARWYKFAVLSGQRIEVKLGGMPADYDLAVFRDIGQAFASQFSPATASSNDLLKLTAEYAPTVFSPTVFSPTVFSPTVFSPDAYAPTVFSPMVFSEDVAATARAAGEDIDFDTDEGQAVLRRRAVDGLLEDGALLTNRELRQRIRPERTQPIEVTSIVRNGEQIIVASMDGDQWQNFMRRAGTICDFTVVDIANLTPGERQREALRIGTLRTLLDMVSNG